DRHLHDVTAKVDNDVTGILQQEMRGERARYQRQYEEQAELHCAGSPVPGSLPIPLSARSMSSPAGGSSPSSVRYWRSKRSDSEISGGVTSTPSPRNCSMVSRAPATAALPAS